MARPACLGGLGIPVTSSARYRVDAAVDPVTRKIVPTVGHPAVGFRLILDGGFQFDPGAMAVIAKTGQMTHIAYIDMLHGNRAVLLHEQGGVDISAVSDIFIAGIMAVHAVF